MEGHLVLKDVTRPELGYMVVSERNPHIKEYEEKLGRMSLTDGVFIPEEAPPDTIEQEP